MLSNLTAAQGFLGYRPTYPGNSPGAAAAVPHRDRVLVATGNPSLFWIRDRRSVGTFCAVGSRPGRSQRTPRERRRLPRRPAVGGPFVRRCHVTCVVAAVIDVAAHRFAGPAWPVPATTTDFAISADGSLVITVRDDAAAPWDVATWDVRTGRRVAVARLGRPPSRSARETGPISVVAARTSERSPPAPCGSGARGRRRPVSGPADHRRAGSARGRGRRGQLAIDVRGRHRSWVVANPRRADSGGCRTLALAVRAHRVYCGTGGGPVQERDLDTGELTGRVLDSQLGGGDLVVESGCRRCRGADAGGRHPAHLREVAHRRPWGGRAPAGARRGLSSGIRPQRAAGAGHPGWGDRGGRPGRQDRSSCSPSAVALSG